MFSALDRDGGLDPHCVTQHRWIYWVRETDCVWSETATPAPKGTGKKAIRTDRGKAG